MSDNSRRRGMNPVLAFILGFLFGLIFLIGSVVGAVLIALNYKIDKVGANKDEDGNYIYINGDPENGGVGTLLQLVKKIAGMAGSPSTMTLGEIENLLPVTQKLTDAVYGALESYVTLDKQEINSLQFAELGVYFKDRVMEIRPAAILDKLGGSLTDNKLIDIVVNGKEADYVEYGDASFPVYYDVFEERDGGFFRVDDGAQLAPDKQDYLEEKGGNYRLYFFKTDVARSTGLCYVTVKADGKFIYDTSDAYLYDYYGDTATLTGNYYYLDGEKIEVSPITLGSFTDGSALANLDEIAVTEFIDNDDELTDKIFGDVTVGDLINGNVDLEEIVNGIEISTFIDVSVDDKILAFLVFDVTDITEEDGVYTAVYNAGTASSAQCTLVVEDGKIKDGVLENGEKIEQTGIKQVSSQVSRLTKTLKIKDLIDVEGNKLLESIQNSTVEGLPDYIDSLSVNELYADQIYSGEIYLAEEYVDTYLYYVESDGGYKLVDREEVRHSFEAGKYYTYGEAQGTWKLLLYEMSGGIRLEQPYSVNNFDKLIENVTANTQEMSLSDLVEMGILTINNEEALDKNYMGQRVGDMSLIEVINAFLNGLSSL